MRKFVFYTFVAILAYLALVHFAGFSADLKTLFGGYTAGVKVLQGR